MKAALRRKPPIASRFALLVSVALGIAACGGTAATPAAPPPHLSPGTTQHASLTISGQVRTYRLFQPASLDPKLAPPLVVALHPCMPGANGDGQASYTHFDDTAATGRFVAVYPDGIGGCWNADPRSVGTDDVAFISRLLDRLTADLPIDRSRIFVAGISGGAAMSYTLACQLFNRLSAIASVSGTMFIPDACHPARPVSILELHGTLDNYDGGGPLNVLSVAAVAQRWTALDGCTGAPTESQTGITMTSVWKPCKSGTVVRLDTVIGGHHTWFGSPYDPVPGEPDANTVVWDFFSGVSRTQP